MIWATCAGDANLVEIVLISGSGFYALRPVEHDSPRASLYRSLGLKIHEICLGVLEIGRCEGTNPCHQFWVRASCHAHAVLLKYSQEIVHARFETCDRGP
jgi:hypothetical protein